MKRDMVLKVSQVRKWNIMLTKLAKSTDYGDLRTAYLRAKLFAQNGQVTLKGR